MFNLCNAATAKEERKGEMEFDLNEKRRIDKTRIQAEDNSTSATLSTYDRFE